MAVLGVSSITPAFPSIGRALGLPSQAVANLITVFTLPGVFLTPVIGILADRWGRESILIPSLVLFGVSGAACIWTRDFRLLLVFRFFQGVGAAALSVLYITLIGDLYKGPERAAAMGYNASILSVGTAIYPAIGGALATLGWYYPFALSILALPLALIVGLGLDNPEPKPEQRLGAYLSSTWKTIRDPGALSLFVLMLLVFLIIYGAYLTYLPFLMEESFMASSLQIGVTMSLMSLATALTSSQLGRLARRWGEREMILVSSGCYALALLLIPRFPSIWLLSLPIVLLGVAQGLSTPVLQTLMAGRAPLEHRGAFMAVNGVALRLGQTVGPPLMGLVFGAWGVDATFYAAALIAAAMLGLTATTISE